MAELLDPQAVEKELSGWAREGDTLIRTRQLKGFSGALAVWARSTRRKSVFCGHSLPFQEGHRKHSQARWTVRPRPSRSSPRGRAEWRRWAGTGQWVDPPAPRAPRPDRLLASVVPVGPDRGRAP